MWNSNLVFVVVPSVLAATSFGMLPFLLSAFLHWHTVNNSPRYNRYHQIHHHRTHRRIPSVVVQSSSSILLNLSMRQRSCHLPPRVQNRLPPSFTLPQRSRCAGLIQTSPTDLHHRRVWDVHAHRTDALGRVRSAGDEREPGIWCHCWSDHDDLCVSPASDFMYILEYAQTSNWM